MVPNKGVLAVFFMLNYTVIRMILMILVMQMPDFKMIENRRWSKLF